jgi:hypothetical protein
VSLSISCSAGHIRGILGQWWERSLGQGESAGADHQTPHLPDYSEGLAEVFSVQRIPVNRTQSLKNQRGCWFSVAGLALWTGIYVSFYSWLCTCPHGVCWILLTSFYQQQTMPLF